MYKLNTNLTYMIPLDGVDLAGLRRHYDRGGVRPLWRVPRGEEYCEFKVNAWRVVESANEDEDDFNTDVIPCHICNLHVPSTYIKEHNNSEIHRNMTNILNLFTHRSRKPVANSSDVIPSESTQFCEECCMAVPKAKLTEHMVSYTHKKSSRKKDLIEQFLKFYSEDLKLQIEKPIREYVNKLNRKNLSFKIVTVQGDFLTINVNKHHFKVHTKNFHGFVEIEGESICILCEAQVLGNVIERHVDSKKHRKRISRNIDTDCIREVNEDFAHCILCNELVLRPRVDSHKILMYHRVYRNHAKAKQGKDLNKNDITARDNENTLYGNTFNQEVNPIDEDAETYGECSNIGVECEEDDVSDRSDENLGDENTYNYIIDDTSHENQNVDENKDVFKDYVDPKSSELENTSQLITEENLDNSESEIKEIPEDYIENINYQIQNSSSDNEIACKVCNKQIKNCHLEIYNHFEGEDHVTKYKQLIKTNRLTKARNKFFCYACKVSITMKNELGHIFGNKHKSKFPNHVIDAACNIYCEMNGGRISVTVQEHSNDSSEQNNESQNLEKSADQTKIKNVNDDNAQLFSKSDNATTSDVENVQPVLFKHYYYIMKTKNPSQAFCRVCKVILTNMLVNIVKHVSGANHVNNYKLYLESNGVEKRDNGFYCRFCDVNLSNSNDIIHITGAKHRCNRAQHYLQQNKDQGNIPEDSIDQEYAYISDEEVNDYINEEKIKAVRKIIENTDQEIFDDTSENNSEEEDETETSHGKAVNQPTNDYVETSVDEGNDDKELPNDQLSLDEDSSSDDNVEENIKSPAVLKNRKLHYHFARTSNPLEVLCKICNSLHDINMSFDSHVIDPLHTRTYNKLLESNHIYEEDNRFYCQICSVFVGNKNEIDHVIGLKHRNKLKDKPISTNDTANEEAGTSNAEENSSETENAEAVFLKPRHHITKTDNPVESLCKICNVTLTNSEVNIETHIMGFNHRNKYKILIDSNGLRKENNSYFCTICNLYNLTGKRYIKPCPGHTPRVM